MSTAKEEVLENRRIEIIHKNPNPLFIKWIEEWLNEAKSKNSKTKYNLKEALDAIKKFPLPLATGRECAILHGFGPKLCQIIDRKLVDYKKYHLDEYNRSINYQEDVKKFTKTVADNDKVKLKKPPSKNKIDLKQNEDEAVVFNPNSFEIILLVDTQETTGKFKKNIDETRFYLTSNNIPYEVRRLSVGDFAWICRHKENELILPYIVERKRMDDFAGSIRDGRFHEQKYRLRNCGLNNVIYLIENYRNNEHIGLPLSTLMQAAVNTCIHSGFQIKYTNNHKDTMLYLSSLTRILIDNFKDKVLISTSQSEIKEFDLNSSVIGLMKFQNFQDGSSKTRNFTVREIFLKQLVQLKYLSVDKAIAITDLYPTPKLLILAYRNCESDEEAEKLLAKIQYGDKGRTIGSKISKILYQFYCTDF